MINLELEPYCADCNEFEVHVEEYISENIYCEEKIDFEISCKNREKCRKICEYFRKEK